MIEGASPGFVLDLLDQQLDDQNGNPLHPLTWTINWGDGSIQAVPGTQATAAHVYANGPAANPISATATLSLSADQSVTYAVSGSVTAFVTHQAPTLTISGSSTVQDGQPYTLELSNIEFGSHTVSAFTINWGDGTSSTITPSAGTVYPVAVPHTYTGQGAHRINATVTDDVGTYNGVAPVDVQVNDPSPSGLQYSLSQTTINEGGTVTLNGSFTQGSASDTDTVVIQWGDGSADSVTALGGSASFGPLTHQYLQAPSGTLSGTYTVHVTVTNEFSNVAAAPDQTVTVSDVAPTVSIVGPTTGTEGTPVTLSASVSNPGPLDNDGPFTYAWTIMRSIDGGQTFQTFSTAATSSITFTPDFGLYKATLLATDPSGLTSAPAIQTINVADVAPQAVIVTPSMTSISEGASISVSGRFSDPGPDDSHTVTINWGDGSSVTLPTVAAGVDTFTSPLHTYLLSFGNQPSSTPVITVTVTDSDHVSGQGQASIQVNDLAPSDVAVTPSASIILPGQPVTLYGGFNDPDSLDPHVVMIDWGDQTSPMVLNLPAGITYFTSPAHGYQSVEPVGVPYVVSVTVSKNDGLIATGSTSVAVVQTTETIGTLTLSSPSLTEGGSLTLSGTFTDQVPGLTHQVMINWGDGTSSTTISLPAGASSFTSPSHTYLQNSAGQPNGQYAISVKVSDQDGAATTKSAAVTVLKAAPTNLSLSLAQSVISPTQPDSLSGSFSDVRSGEAHTVHHQLGRQNRPFRPSTWPRACSASAT